MSDQEKSTPSTPIPAGWQESAGYRETYLLPFSRPEDVAALQHVAKMLHEMALETARDWPAPEEPAIRAELRAAARDLRHLQGFLANTGRSRQVSSLPPSQESLSKLADELAPEVAQLAETLESAVEEDAKE